jgi:hypothetical protein
MCGNVGHDISEFGKKYDPDPTHLGNQKLSAALQVVRNPNELPGLNTKGATALDVSALGTGLASKPGARKVGRVAGLVIGAAAGGEAAFGGEGAAGGEVAAGGEAATSGSTAATGVAPAATQGTVGATAGTAAPAAGTTAGMTVTQYAQLAGAIAGSANAAYSIYAAKHAPQPPDAEKPPPIPQPGKQPDFVGARKRNLFGDEGPFARDSTFLTGAGGVPGSSLNLGRNILLGS